MSRRKKKEINEGTVNHMDLLFIQNEVSAFLPDPNIPQIMNPTLHTTNDRSNTESNEIQSQPFTNFDSPFQFYFQQMDYSTNQSQASIPQESQESVFVPNLLVFNFLQSISFFSDQKEIDLLKDFEGIGVILTIFGDTSVIQKLQGIAVPIISTLFLFNIQKNLEELNSKFSGSISSNENMKIAISKLWDSYAPKTKRNIKKIMWEGRKLIKKQKNRILTIIEDAEVNQSFKNFVQTQLGGIHGMNKNNKNFKVKGFCKCMMIVQKLIRKILILICRTLEVAFPENFNDNKRKEKKKELEALKKKKKFKKAIDDDDIILFAISFEIMQNQQGYETIEDLVKIYWEINPFATKDDNGIKETYINNILKKNETENQYPKLVENVKKIVESNEKIGIIINAEKNHQEVFDHLIKKRTELLEGIDVSKINKYDIAGIIIHYLGLSGITMSKKREYCQKVLDSSSPNEEESPQTN